MHLVQTNLGDETGLVACDRFADCPSESLIEIYLLGESAAQEKNTTHIRATADERQNYCCILILYRHRRLLPRSVWST
jgi:hypothetical protein